MSQILPDKAKPLVVDSSQEVSDEKHASNWRDRWVDVVQIGEDVVQIGEPVAATKPGALVISHVVERRLPMVTPGIVIVVCFGFILILVTIDLGVSRFN